MFTHQKPGLNRLIKQMTRNNSLHSSNNKIMWYHEFNDGSITKMTLTVDSDCLYLCLDNCKSEITIHPDLKATIIGLGNGHLNMVQEFLRSLGINDLEWKETL